MTAFLDTLLRMSAVGSIVIITVLIVRLCLKNAPKVYSYILWAIVLLRLLCPFTVESSLSTIPKELPFDESIEELSQPYTQPYVETPLLTEPVIRPYPGEGGNNESGETHKTDSGDRNETMSVGSITHAPAAKPDLGRILSIIWLGGVAAMAVWGLWGYLRLKRRLRGAMACDNGVYLSYKVDSPFVLGFFRPKIYLPADIASGEWEYIVMHERCHIRRGDHITRVLAFAALAIHWFNPLVWLAFILSGKDMEMSCDEAVIRTLGPQVRGDYSASLLSLATGRPILSAMPLAFGEGDPKGRIRNLAKWRKPTRAMIIAALIVCVVAAVCLLTDPPERDAQIRVNGRVYSYVGSEENPIGTIWELGMLEGILHRSGEEPDEDFHGTNLDEKYAGQPLYAGLDGRIYLFDENGYFLPFELPKGEIISGPTEVARGDFNRDGQSDFITVTEYIDCVEIVLADSQSAKILWKDTASLAEGQQKCFIAQKGEEGDSIIRYTFNEDGYCLYRRFYIGENGELDEEKARSPIDNLYEDRFTDPEAISYSLPENSTFLLSTYGGSTVIGPIKSAYIASEPGSEEQLCLEALEKVLAAESAQIKQMYGLGIITNQVTLLYEGDDWYWSDAGQGYSTGIVCVDGDYCAYEQAGGEAQWERCEHTPIIMPNPFALNDYPREFTGREEMDGGYYMLHFTADPVAAGMLYAPNAAGEAEESFMFSADGELVSISRSVPVNDRGDGGEQLYMETIAVEYQAPGVLLEPIMAHYTACVNSIAEREKAVTENAVHDEGTEIIAVPYGESLVIDLDGDGIEEVLNMKVGISGVYSLSVNGEELFSQVKSYVSQFNTAEESRYPDYYVLRTYEGDYSPKICVYDGGPSSDPITHIFTYFRSLQYVGSIPCHPSKMTLEGNHLVSGPARLRVFQTWYSEHTWEIPSNGTKLRQVERDFYYVEDFEFISYHIGDTYYPQSKYGPLLCDVYAYEKMDISADAEVLKEGTELSILGTDNAEWILVADRSGEEYYLHLSGINACSIDTPQGEAMGNAVFHGLHYFD